MENKKCTKCGAEKPIGEFAPTKQQLKGGVKSWCRECEREYKRQWVQKNPVRRRDQINGWKASNREKVRGWNREYSARIRRENPVKSHAWERRARLKREYGVTPEWFDAQVISQNNQCEICGGPPPAKGFSIDHCHLTKRVRALLCSGCNTALHKMERNIEWVRKAEAYLGRHGDESSRPPTRSANETLWGDPV